MPIDSFFGDLLVILEQVAILAAVAILRALGVDVFTKIQWLWNLGPAVIRRAIHRPIIILYTDCDEEVAITHKLARELQAALQIDAGKKSRIVTMRDGEGLLRRPLLTNAVMAIVLLATDVTRLSINPRRRDTIQRHLVHYCQAGGILILGHDVLYRRVQNTRLQRLAGTRLVKFTTVHNGIKYTKLESGSRASTNIRLLEKLPSSFVLEEQEILSGVWASDTEFIYVLDGSEERPLVTRRTSGAGCVFWLNAGDQVEEGPPHPIAQPSREFVMMLATLIYYGLTPDSTRAALGHSNIARGGNGTPST